MEDPPETCKDDLFDVRFGAPSIYAYVCLRRPVINERRAEEGKEDFVFSSIPSQTEKISAAP